MRFIIIMFLLQVYSMGLLHAQDYFYYYKGEKQALRLNTEFAYISVSQQNVPNAEALRQAVSGALDNAATGGMEIGKFEEDVTANNLAQAQNGGETRYWAELSWHEASSENDYLQKLRELRANDQIDRVAPYFESEHNSKIGLSDYFYVKLKEDSDYSRLQDMAGEYNAVVVGRNRFLPEWVTLRCTDASDQNAMDIANQLHESGLFETAFPDLIYDVKLNSTNDPFYDQQWAIENTGQYQGNPGVDINASDAWNIATGNGVKVAVIDQGFERNHPDLNSNNAGSGYDPQTGGSSSVYGGHGTACAGIIGAVRDNSIGISGIAPQADLSSVSVSFSGLNITQNLANGIMWAADNGAAVISNSWSGGSPNAMIDDAIDHAFNNGRNGLGSVVVFSTGNDNDSVPYPTNSNPDILAVGAMSQCGERTNPNSCDTEDEWGSNYGSQVDVVAPGALVATTDRQDSSGYNPDTPIHLRVGGSLVSNDFNDLNYTRWFNGTSAACPHVAAVAALILERNPCLTHEEVNDIIERTAQKLNNYNFSQTSGRPNGTWNLEVGYGLVDAYQAVLQAEHLYLQNITESGTTEYDNYPAVEAGRNVTTFKPVGDYVVSSSADVTVEASEEVVFEPGVTVEKGATLTASIDTMDCNTQQSSSRMAAQSGSDEIDRQHEVQRNQKRSLAVHPNPTTGRVTIEHNDDIHQVMVYSMTGDLVLRKKIAAESKKSTLDLSSQPKGVYLLRCAGTNELRQIIVR